MIYQEWLQERIKMSSIMVDSIDGEKMRYLLRLLSLGKLSRDSASELKPLLLDELEKARGQNDIEHEKELDALIKILDSYILGKVDLMVRPDVIVSNIV
jgi:hypothetical protein